MNSDIDDISQDGSSVCGNQSINGGHGGTISAAGSLPSSSGGVTCTGNVKMSGTKRSKEQKTTRVRTVLNEKQLHTLRTCYAANPRPDALMKEQLVEMTGLSPRVIRVWFQNKRCKDKKRQIMVKQMDQHQQVFHGGFLNMSARLKLFTNYYCEGPNIGLTNVSDEKILIRSYY